MALKVAVANGNWSTAGTWESVAASAAPHASTNITLDGTHRQTATFTAPGAAGETCTGVLFYVAEVGSAGTMTIELQENSAGWVTVDSEALAVTNLKVGWNYCRFTTPYDFAAITADYYRFDFVGAGLAGTTSIAQTAVANQWSYICSYDTTGVPAATDDVFITGQINNAGTTVITVTVDGTRTIGSGTNTKGLDGADSRTQMCAVIVGANGKITWDSSASATLNCKGHFIVCYNGSWEIGTASVPYPVAYVATLSFKDATANYDYNLCLRGGGTISLQGVPKSSTSLWYSTPDVAVNPGVANDGETARKFVTNDAVNWIVGDELAFTPSAVWTQVEYRYIETKTDASTYTLESSVGGGNDPLDYAHSIATYVVNLTRNVVITANTNFAWTFRPYSTIAFNCNIDWIRMIENGYIYVGNAENQALSINMDYSVSYDANSPMFYYLGTTQRTHTGNIAVKSPNRTGIYNYGESNLTLVDNFAIDCQTGMDASNSNANFNITRLRILACSSALGSSFVDSNFYDCEHNACQNYGLSLNYNNYNTKYINYRGGNVLAASADLILWGQFAGKPIFINSVFGTINTSYAYSSIVGARNYHNYALTTNDHRETNYYGDISTTGAGLTDTKVRTAGTLNVKMAPYSSRSLKWSFLVLARPASTVAVRGYLWRTATPATINLYLPGSTTPDTTQSFGSTTDTAYQPWIVSAYHSGTVPLLATVEIVATGTALYVADIDDGVNLLNNLTTWHDGQIVPVIYDEIGNPGSMWSYVTEGTETAKESLRLIRSACIGKSDGHTSSGGTIHYRDNADTKNRITATCDSVGNRSAVTTDAT